MVNLYNLGGLQIDFWMLLNLTWLWHIADKLTLLIGGLSLRIGITLIFRQKLFSRCLIIMRFWSLTSIKNFQYYLIINSFPRSCENCLSGSSTTIFARLIGQQYPLNVSRGHPQARPSVSSVVNYFENCQSSLQGLGPAFQ